MRRGTSVMVAAVVGACGGGSSNLDARDADVPGDQGPRPDGACGAGVAITGELVDFDASAGAFAGVAGAMLRIGGGAAVTTPPNGRFELCASGAPPVLVTIDAPGDRLDGVAYIDTRTPASRVPSLRSLTPARAASFYQAHGLTFDAGKAHVLVFVAGDRSDVALDRAHGTALAADEIATDTYAWAAGVVGRYVLFPNVDVVAPTATLSGDYQGPHTFPIAAGTITWVSVAWFFL